MKEAFRIHKEVRDSQGYSDQGRKHMSGYAIILSLIGEDRNPECLFSSHTKQKCALELKLDPNFI